MENITEQEKVETLIKLNEKSFKIINGNRHRYNAPDRTNITRRMGKYYKEKNDLIKQLKYDWITVLRKSKMNDV